MSAIFEDLGIDYEIMMTEPETFWAQVTSAADKLKGILKADNSIDNYVKNKIATENFDFKRAEIWTQDFYEYADASIPVGALKEMADKLRKLARDLEYMAREKAMLEIADDQTIDKSIAHDMYKDLKSKTDMIVEAWEVLNIRHDVTKLASMPGNYGGNMVLTKHVFVFKGENTDGIPYREFTAVVRKLEKSGVRLPEMKNKMDLVDYLRAHPELNVTVSEQR